MNASRPATASAPSAQATIVSRDADLESYRDITDDVIESDFVPYAFLYDAQSIATKNGELLQIFRITGLGFDAQIHGDLRRAIRDAIRECIPDTSYAVWTHTLRRRHQLVAPAEFPDTFSAGVDAAWSETHPASASFVNELYITIVKAGPPVSLRDRETVKNSFLPHKNTNMRLNFIEKSARELTQTTDAMLRMLESYGAARLTVVERNGDYYSEQLEFLEKLINLEQRAMPVPVRDLSHVLTSGDITFGYNSMEVRTAEGKRRFACMVTVKEYKEATLRGIDKFLDIPCEMIVSQSFDFIGAQKVREKYERQARYLEISGDREMAEWMEIGRLVGRHTYDARDFGEQQTTLFLIAPSIRQLEKNVRMVQRALSRLGMVAIREDLRLEECYWAQLPANFPFITRKQSTDTQHLAGFATVQTQPMGNAAGSPWGPPVSLLTTMQDAPYFFNFHRDNRAHTIILGKRKTGRTSMLHFLLSQARRLPVRIWYLDLHGRAESLMTALGGTAVTPATPQLQLNPLALADTPANREFLAVWLSTLIDPEGRQLSRSSLEFFQSLIAELMQLPPAMRRLSNLLPIVRTQDAMLAASLKRWCAGGEHGELFDMPTDNFRTDPLTLWKLAAWRDQPALRAPLAAYLLHRLTLALDGTPTLIVLDEGFTLLNSPLFGQRAPLWLDYIARQNAAAILTTEAIEASAALAYTAAISHRAASIFVMPDANPGAEYMMGFGLNESDLGALAHMNPRLRHVLLKRGEQSTPLKMDLSGLGPLMVTISGRLGLSPQRSAADLLSELMGYSKPVGAES